MLTTSATSTPTPAPTLATTGDGKKRKKEAERGRKRERSGSLLSRSEYWGTSVKSEKSVRSAKKVKRESP